MSLKFRMTSDDYYQAYKFRNKKLKIHGDPFKTMIFIVFSVCLIVNIILMIVAQGGKGAVNCFWFFIILPFPFLENRNLKKNVDLMFGHSRILNSENNIKLYDEGVEIINDFEKIYAPFESIFAVKETPTHLLILMNNSSVFGINKINYQSEELNNIIAFLNTKMIVEGGK